MDLPFFMNWRESLPKPLISGAFCPERQESHKYHVLDHNIYHCNVKASCYHVLSNSFHPWGLSLARKKSILVAGSVSLTYSGKSSHYSRLGPILVTGTYVQFKIDDVHQQRILTVLRQYFGKVSQCTTLSKTQKRKKPGQIYLLDSSKKRQRNIF
jgi:hypothetical protein